MVFSTRGLRSGVEIAKLLGSIAFRDKPCLRLGTCFPLHVWARTSVTLTSCAESHRPWLQVKASMHPPSWPSFVILMLNSGPVLKTASVPYISKAWMDTTKYRLLCLKSHCREGIPSMLCCRIPLWYLHWITMKRSERLAWYWCQSKILVSTSKQEDNTKT